MVSLPTTFEIAGRHLQAYESIYKEVDPNFRGIINASDAAGYLKRSNLGNVVLGQIWELSDQNKRGFLDKQGFFVALKLISVVQNGMDPVPSNILADLPAPSFTQHAASPSLPMFGSQEVEWIITPKDRTKYDEIFESLGPQNGKLGGDQVKPVLLNSGLPTDILGKIWDLSDIDKDGCLDREEMSVALHLVYRSLEGDPIAPQLPLAMIPPSKRALASSGPGSAAGSRRATLTGAVQVLPSHAGAHNLRNRTGSMTSIENLSTTSIGSVGGGGIMPNSPSLGTSRSLSGTPIPSLNVKPPAPWIVDKSRYEMLFVEADKDHDGLVSGADVKQIFLQSGLSQVYLAHIWNLCDIKSAGTLNVEQFALAMHFIEQKRHYNVEPPSELSPDLVPPSFRPNPAGMTDMGTSTQHDSSASSLLTSGGGEKAGPPAPASTGNKEIDRMQAEIHELQRERREFESQIIQLDADTTIKQSEIRNLEVELNTLDATVKQLERQRGEAQKRLDDLENQRQSVQTLVEELQNKVNSEEVEIRTLRMDVETSAASAKSQEDELNRKRSELQQLRDEESRADVKLQMQKGVLQQITQRETSAIQGTEKAQRVIDQVRDKRTALNEKLQKLEAMLQSGDFSSFDVEPSLMQAATFDLDVSHLNTMNQQQHRATTGVARQHPMMSAAAATSNPWNSSVKPNPYSYQQFDAPSHQFGANIQPSVAGFGQDPFQSSDPFAGHDPFTAGGGAPTAADDPFASSLSSSAFGGASAAGRGGLDFENDPFGGTANNSPGAWAAQGGGLDGLGAPGGGGKRPPPRPAPPKSRPITPKDPMGGGADPFSSAPADPWGGGGAGHETGGANAGFADFADFGKFS